MAGNLTMAELKSAIGSGAIDTVLVAMVDMQGRLIGKRFQARVFRRRRHEETHGCDYLLANDIDMEPVPGYAAASWDKGYGDFVMKPDLATLRQHALAGGHGAGAVPTCSTTTTTTLPHSPRAMLKRQLAAAVGAEDARLLCLRAGVLPVRRELRERGAPSATTASRRPAPTSRTTTSCRPPRRRA